MKNFFDTLRDSLTGVVFCPRDGKLPKGFKPVSVEPWQPQPRRERGRPKRPTSVEQVEKINGSLANPARRGPATRLGEAGTDEPIPAVCLVDGGIPDRGWEHEEFASPDFFIAVEAQGIRSLMQPAISSADWSWRAPAARCRSCGTVTWIASIADGIRCLSNARHRKGCTCPPSRLEIELTCV